jgi:signal transduction histidine kinase
VTVLTNILGVTILLALAIALLRVSILGDREALRSARTKLEQVEADVRVDAAHLHEIRATIAGLTSASMLIHQADNVSDDRRHTIETMVDSEMGRLQRLLHAEHPTEHVPVDIDAVIQPVLLRHQLRGFPVHWIPSGERVLAHGDHVAEVVNVLLENAFQHAAGAGARVHTRRIDGVIEIAVADSGPGIDRSVRPRIFEWGERSNGSSGSGIGLNVAKQLTVELGGYLRLVDSPASGATFVLGLPAEERP